MSKGTLIRCFGTLLLLLFISFRLFSQNRELSSVRMMFYNAENFFDIYDDPLRNDNDFLPNGVMHWNRTRYYHKVLSIYKVIMAAGEWNPPSLIGFCEVENRSVLEDLISDTYLTRYKYSIIHEESRDPRGIDVCLIYRKDLLKLLDYKYILPEDRTVIESRTRSVLYSRWLIAGDTLHLFLNHWQSRRGGVLRGEATRSSVSKMLRSKADSLMKIRGSRAKIIIAGDFNCTPEDKEMSDLLRPGRGSQDLINLSEQYARRGEGTYRYLGRWEMLDQVIVSSGLLKGGGRVRTSEGSLRIFKSGFLLQNDTKYPGMSPFPTYRGFKYQGGYSDHLPVILDLEIR